MTAGRADRSFPRTYRLSSSEEFRRVYRDAQHGRAGPFAWHARVNDRRHARLGLTVPKRVVKQAKDRSRIKRLIRESFRHHRDELPPVDIVVSVKTLPRGLDEPGAGGAVDRIWQDVVARVGDAPERIV